MTNLERIRSMNARELATLIDGDERDRERCEMCIWEGQDCVGMCLDGITAWLKEETDMDKKIMELIEAYSEEYPLAEECGGEYIYQSDEAQIDAIELVAGIFDLYVEEMKSNG